MTNGIRRILIAAAIGAAPSVAHADGAITLADFSSDATVVDFSGGTNSNGGYVYTVGAVRLENEAIGPEGDGFNISGTRFTDNDGSGSLGIGLGGSYQRVGFEITGDQAFDIFFGGYNATPIHVSVAGYETRFVGFESMSGINSVVIFDSAGGYQYGFRTTIGNLRLDGAIAPAPEPGEWAMIVAGLGIVGGAARRRANRETASSGAGR